MTLNDAVPLLEDKKRVQMFSSFNLSAYMF